MNRSITAFIAGATGYTGQAVARALVASGHHAVAHVRPDSARLAHWEAHFRELGATVDTTPWALAPMTETLRAREASVVFALLGTTRKRARGDRVGDQAASYETVDYGLSALLCDAAEAAGTEPQFVYLSAMGVGEARPAGAYMQARWKMEQKLRAGPLPWVVVRPSFITGADREESRPGERMGAAVANALLTVAGGLGARRLRDRYRSQTADELGQTLVRAALDPLLARTVLLSDGRPM